MENKKENLIEKIEKKIKENKIKMKPKWYFIFKSTMIISFVCILFLLIIYIGNFILLIFHEHQEVFDALPVGTLGVSLILEFIKTIPVLLVLLILVFIFSLFKLVEDYTFVYRKNLLYLILFLILFIIIAVANVHIFLDKEFKMVRFGERGEVPFLKKVHKYYLGNKASDAETKRDFIKKVNQNVLK